MILVNGQIKQVMHQEKKNRKKQKWGSKGGCSAPYALRNLFSSSEIYMLSTAAHGV